MITRSIAYGTLYITIGAALLLHYLGFMHNGALNGMIDALMKLTLFAMIGYGLVLTKLHVPILAFLQNTAERIRAYSERHALNALGSPRVRGAVYIVLAGILLLNEYGIFGASALGSFATLIMLIIALGIIGHGLALTGALDWFTSRFSQGIKHGAEDVAQHLHKHRRARGIMYLIVGLLLTLSMLGIVGRINHWVLALVGAGLIVYGAIILEIPAYIQKHVAKWRK